MLLVDKDEEGCLEIDSEVLLADTDEEGCLDIDSYVLLVDKDEEGCLDIDSGNSTSHSPDDQSRYYKHGKYAKMVIMQKPFT